MLAAWKARILSPGRQAAQGRLALGFSPSRETWTKSSIYGAQKTYLNASKQ
jgi:hypothetical protein